MLPDALVSAPSFLAVSAAIAFVELATTGGLFAGIFSMLSSGGGDNNGSCPEQQCPCLLQ